MKILIINVPIKSIIEQYDIPDYPAIALGYLYSYLKGKQVDVHVIDTKLEKLSFEAIINKVQNLKPDLIGISSMTHEISLCGELCDQLKRVDTKIITVVGGVHISAVPEETLKSFASIDIGIIGEGEEIFHNVIKNINDLAKVGGIVFRTNGTIVLNQAAPEIKNLDLLPIPDWSAFPRSPRYHIITARGCPFHCSFCMTPYGKRVRERSPKNVLAELKTTIETFDPEYYRFNDETFGFNMKRANLILDYIIDNKLDKIPKSASMRANIVTEEVLKKMKRAGFEYIDYGVESGNKEVLKRIHKNVTMEQTEKAVAMTKKAGIRVGANFILGHPYETMETAMETINYAVKLNADFNAIGIMCPYPGTEIYSLAMKGEGNYILLSTDWKDYNKQIGNALELKNINRKQLEKLQMIGYLKILVWNFRFLDLITFIWQNRHAGFAFFKKFFNLNHKTKA
jgi:radical SAM superfamily enzyme YgiQ (UPF0313 family)|tara:strand:- start:83 stop:1447 length:1365 start_codon:yes stop_codon:yes gene_type:complete